jgi:hypothetical protein
MKVVHAFLALMFLSFTIVQYNDPDPWLWIAIYGSMTALSVLAFFQKFLFRFMIAQVIAFTVYAVLLAPGVWAWWTSPDRSLLFDDLAKMQFYYIEEAREFLGLIICLSVLAFYSFLSRRKAG